MYLLPRLILYSVAVGFLFHQCNFRNESAKKISVDEVYEIVNDSLRVNSYIILDMRGRMDYIRGHLVSSFWLSPDSIESKLNIILNDVRPIVVYGSDDAENSRFSELLLRKGITNVFIMDGGFSEWVENGYPAAIQLVRNTSDKIVFQHKNISTSKVDQIIKSPYSDYAIIDIRPYPEFSDGHIGGAQSIPYEPINEFVVRIEEQNFNRNKPIIIYGNATGDITMKAIEVMLRNDFSQVYLLTGGIEEWASKKYAIE